MSKKIYQVSLSMEKNMQTGVIEDISIKEDVYEVTGETFDSYEMKARDSSFNYKRQKHGEFGEYTGVRVVNPNNPSLTSLYSTNEELIPQMKHQLIDNYIISSQNEYRQSYAAYEDFKRFKTTFTSGEKIHHDTFFEKFILKIAIAQSELKEYISQNPDNEKDVLLYASLSLHKDKVNPSAEMLWITGILDDGSLELTDYSHTPCLDVEPDSINKVVSHKGVNNFPFVRIAIQGDFNIHETALSLREEMIEQVDSFIAVELDKMNKNLFEALKLKSSI